MTPPQLTEAERTLVKMCNEIIAWDDGKGYPPAPSDTQRVARALKDRITSSTEAQAPQDDAAEFEITHCNAQDCGSKGDPDNCPWAPPSSGRHCGHYARYYREAKAEPAPLAGTETEDVVKWLAMEASCGNAPVRAYMAKKALHLLTSRPECGVPTRDVVVDQEALAKWFHEREQATGTWSFVKSQIGKSLSANQLAERAYEQADALIASGIIKAMPTRDELAEWFGDYRARTRCVETALQFADSLTAFLRSRAGKV